MFVLSSWNARQMLDHYNKKPQSILLPHTHTSSIGMFSAFLDGKGSVAVTSSALCIINHRCKTSISRIIFFYFYFFKLGVSTFVSVTPHYFFQKIEGQFSIGSLTGHLIFSFLHKILLINCVRACVCVCDRDYVCVQSNTCRLCSSFKYIHDV